MKQIITTVGLMVVVTITAMIILSVEGREIRKDELNRAVSTSVKKTVKDSQINNQKIIKSDEEMIEYFIQVMSINISGKEDMEIEVMDADYKEGMLDVLVTEKYKHLNGKEGEISVRKCAIAE